MTKKNRIIFICLFFTMIFFQGCDSIIPIELISDKKVYTSDDKIMLTLRFIYDKVEIYADLPKSLNMRIGKWGNGEYTSYFEYPTLKYLLETRKSNQFKEEKIIEIYPAIHGKNICVIKGKTRQRGSQIEVEFENYGKFLVPDPVDIYIRFLLVPIKLSPYDSLEYYSNSLQIKIIGDKK